ncbi:hypothetical protein Acsp03_64530 [Actinomadura sp. NBRC 104412]|uniref:hypothetical protein n=1 Tax=Actinomadura sp. NBRC 104412 TaxID=3032203 RepID=UPI0024A08C48|nr:hypothetical protein [Actinomadura sp. NBRC 104412]GLZ08987.1 hypothetical protein Acsp03_64530 [Actinomadura sp. NBRC 104412]
MRRIAISGHRGMPSETEQLVDQAIRKLLATTTGDITGLSCLADGADQIFARAVLDHGGTIEAIVPARQYRDGLPEAAHAEYDRLFSAASGVHTMDFTESDSEAHMAASAYMIDHADELWAVWDGQPARGYGGTADVVAHAHEHRVPIRIIWPDGAQRD